MLRGLVVLASLAACSGGKDKPAKRDAAVTAPAQEAAVDTAPATDVPVDASADVATEPASSGEPSKAAQIEQDGTRACVRRLDGQVRCWGSADGDTVGAVVPYTLTSSPEAASIHVAYGQLAIVTRSGDLAIGPLAPPEQPRLALVPTGEGIDVRLATATRAYVLMRTGDVVEVNDGKRADKPIAINVVALASRAADNVDALHRDGTVTTITGGKTYPVKDLKNAEGLFGVRCAQRRGGGIACWTPVGKPTTWTGPQNVVDILADGRTVCTIAGPSLGCAGKLVTLPGKPMSLSAGGSKVGGSTWCVLLDSGEVACWGANDVGQLGDGTLIDRETPASIAGATSAASPTPPATPDVPVSRTPMDWSDLPDGCKRTEKMATVGAREPIMVSSSYVRTMLSEVTLWFADFPLPGGTLEGRVARGAQQARWFALGKGKPGKLSSEIVRGRYRTKTPTQRAASGSNVYGKGGRAEADVLVEKVTDRWICGTVLVGDERYPFSARKPK